MKTNSNSKSKRFINLNILVLLTILIPIISPAGCSGNGDEKANKEEDQRDNSTQMITQQKQQQGLDLSKIKICELVPDELVAQTLGAKIIKPAQSNDLGPSHGCTYTLDPSGTDNFEVCIVWLNPVSTFTSLEDELETAKELSQVATGENLQGLGDKAFAVHNKTEDQSIIHVLLKDKLYLQVGVEHFDDAKKLTELILSKLKNI
jgi:hypothetical protein